MSKATDAPSRTGPLVDDVLAEIWRRTFRRSSVSPGDDFFALGGTSLTAVRFLAQVEERFGLDALTPEDLYEHPRFEDIVLNIRKNANL